jgi:SAM-dependent methyltransferase
VQAQLYEAVRPTYPPAIINKCLGLLQQVYGAEASLQRPIRVLDVGAGTGKLTRLLADIPWLSVSAAEPSEGMCQALRKAVPGGEERLLLLAPRHSHRQPWRRVL